MMTKIHRRRWLATGCSALAVLAAGCSGTAIPSTRHFETIVSVGTAVLKAPTFTDADELRLAQATAKKVEAENKVWSDPLLEAYLTQIMEKIVAVAKPRPWPYRVKVINQADPNAFTPGGGLVYIHAGLLARMESEAQFAMILAHEVAHVTEGHVIEGVKARYGIQLLGQLAAVAAGQTGVLPPGMLQLIYDYSMNAAINGHGRSREAEADEIGLGYLVKAGWDPREASKAFEALLRESGMRRKSRAKLSSSTQTSGLGGHESS
jgi:predicted Zn-dependent protease